MPSSLRSRSSTAATQFAAHPSPMPREVEPARSGAARPGTLRLAALTGGLLMLVAVLGLLDITQGTAAVGPAELWNALTGHAGNSDVAVILSSRLPRMYAGILVGVALGAAGAALQAISRNVLASPDTLAVSAGAYGALAIAAVTGAAIPLVASSAVAFGGALLATVVVLAISGLGSGTVRLVLAGSALALGIGSITSTLLLLFPERTVGLFQWGEGSISQNGLSGVTQMVGLVLAGVVGLLIVGRRLDALGLGDDAARSIGVNVPATRLTAVIFAALLSAAAVTLAGPIGFVGLCAPALLRPIAFRIPGAMRARVFLPLAGLFGAALVLASDVALRAIIPPDISVAIPTGLVTSLIGAVFLVVLAFRARDTGGVVARDRYRLAGRGRLALVLVILGCVLIGLMVTAILLGDTKLLLGDVVNWLQGRAGRFLSYVLDTRAPRVAAALVAGAALALAGTLVQAVTRNPLAEPGILGVSGGAGLGAVLLVTTVPLAGSLSIAAAAFVGATLAAALVFGLAARGGFPQNRLVLIGVGVSAATTAIISLLIVLTDPYNATKALTWLSGSTYGREFSDVLPVLIVLLLGMAVTLASHRSLDLIAIDDDTPRLLGVRLGRTRLMLLAMSVMLTATAIAAVGAIGFVGLVAPHAARALVGRRHVYVTPVAILLGAILVGAADLVGRTVIAPSQLGAGLLTAVLGTPYFIWLLWRSRR